MPTTSISQFVSFFGESSSRFEFDSDFFSWARQTAKFEVRKFLTCKQSLNHASVGIEGISRSSVSRLAASLDEIVEAFRNRPLEGSYPYLQLDALHIKVREAGRIVAWPACTPWASTQTACVSRWASTS